MKAHDPGEGYRGIRPAHLRRAIKDADSAGAAPPPYARYVLGVQAEKLMAGLADAEEITSVMAEVVLQAEADVKENMAALLQYPDLSSPEAKDAHFKSRVAAGVLTYLNNLIRSGVSAGEQIQNQFEG